MPISSTSLLVSDLEGMALFKSFEGGAVYTLLKDAKFLVVIDESSIANILPPEELEGIDLIKVIEFDSEQARSDYLTSKFADG